MVLLSVERALNEARKELEREAQKKAEKALSREKQKMQKELESLRKGKQKADDEKRQADEARLVAENAKAIADAEKDAAARERDRLQAESSKCKDVTINEFLKRLQLRPRDSDTDSDDDGNGDGQPRSKRSKSQSSEFDSDGALVKIPKYEGQNLHGLVLFKRVSADIQQLIGQNKFFPLEKMYTGDEITTSQIGHVTVTTTTKNVPKKITNKSELFYLLYNFGQYYLQLYPEKASSFLEYCAFLTKICDDFTAQSLVELDNLIRKEYVTHPQWNWDQTNAVIDKLYMYFAREKSNLKSDSVASASSGVFPSTSGGGSKGRGKPRKQAYFQYQSPLPSGCSSSYCTAFRFCSPTTVSGAFCHTQCLGSGLHLPHCHHRVSRPNNNSRVKKEKRAMQRPSGKQLSLKIQILSMRGAPRIISVGKAAPSVLLVSGYMSVSTVGTPHTGSSSVLILSSMGVNWFPVAGFRDL